ncbi:hypothetical protein L208DRAFT_362396 [Tricholoma matsutake]|nr:hypothetical protein L208DRAFT_362396 [Tricholoma matsutake 945]
MVGHGLETCTRVPKVIKFGSPQRKNIDFAFVDTPAFNYNAKTDLEVLQTDAKRLGAFFGGKVKLAGILYFHRIPDYPTNEVRSDLTVFRELCKKQLLDKQSIDPLKQLEKDAYKNVIFVTTMWDQVDEERGSLFEKELMSKHWKRMIDLGATAARFDGSSAAAWNIIERCINV